MCNPRASTSLLAAFLLLYSLVTLVSAQGSTPSWQTLTGKPPLVVARGGFSGLLPDSSSGAYQLALFTSVPDVALLCDLQLTKDGVGICAPDLTLQNFTDISNAFKNKDKTYLVNDVETRGWFSVDYTYDELLTSTVLVQGIYSRSNKFEGNLFSIQTVENVTALKPETVWLNVQHDAFYTQHNLSMRNYVLGLSRRVVINYISSPEVAFLRGIAPRLNANVTKLVFRFLEPDNIEPSTNQSYSSLLKNLSLIKTFASGILVPKGYIWPVDATLYLKPHTSLVPDAHKLGLEVFAYDFYNDVPFSFNYSYDPVSEYLSFIDNGDFSVDGVLSDFPISPSEARDCFSQLGKNASDNVNVLVISKNGASGDYPGCTDKAYQKAIADGANIIDCPVQMSKDGIPFCMSTINLIDSTTVAQSSYSNLALKIPELSNSTGIFSFNLTWTQIHKLTPSISNPQSIYQLFRNPKFRNAGTFLTLSDFLAMAKNASSLSGVLISLENTPYLMEKQQMAVTDVVLDALSKAGYENKIMIQSPDSSVLKKFKGKKNYELVYKVDENIRSVLDAAMQDIKTFADSVVVSKMSVFPDNSLFLTGATDVVPKIQSAGLPVYVELFSNEFVSQAWDFFSDANVEINSYVVGANISGIVTDFPFTSARYKKNRCLNLGKSTPAYMSPVQPGSLIQLVTREYLPPAEAPYPVLDEAEVAESPLAPVQERVPSSTPGTTTTAPPPRPNGQPKTAVCFFMSNLAILLTLLLMV
ncbi:glycerophosphodiester phosphodiesterase GDPDL3-like [Euphorbia lathyris]|uniref:glycerophosphodiester phosphodiesterase GDPDL3-like n=1 Tax=Euphorbia lathyris TaxID=212925 RepID=UPI003313A17E